MVYLSNVSHEELTKQYWILYKLWRDSEDRLKTVEQQVKNMRENQNNEDNECNGFDMDGNPIKYGFK